MSQQQLDDYKQLPWKAKRRIQTAERKRREKEKKENPAGSLSLSPRRMTRVKPQLKPKPVVNLPAPVAKVPEERMLISLAYKYKNFNKDDYARLKDSRSDPMVEAGVIVCGTFRLVLAKYKNLEPQQLMALVITDAIRPGLSQKASQAKKERPKPPVKRPLTERQMQQAAQLAARQTVKTVATPASRKKRRSAKKVSAQAKLDKVQRIQQALDEYLKVEPALAATLQATSQAELKQLLRTDESIMRFAEAQGTWLRPLPVVYSYLEVAVSLLLSHYEQARLAAEREAEAQRAEQKAAACAAAAEREQKRRLQQNRLYGFPKAA